MSTFFVFRLTFIICAAACFFSSVLRAESCSDVVIQSPVAGDKLRLQMLEDIATVLRRPLLAEIPFVKDDNKVRVLPDATNLESLAASLSTDKGVVGCEIMGSVIHIFEYSARDSVNNALNHRFPEFRIPSNVELFTLKFRYRINNEAFRSHDSDLVSGSDTGATSSEAENHKLIVEQMSSLSARDVLIHVANQAPILCVVQVQTDPQIYGNIAWRASDRNLILRLLRMP